MSSNTCVCSGDYLQISSLDLELTGFPSNPRPSAGETVVLHNMHDRRGFDVFSPWTVFLLPKRNTASKPNDCVHK